MPDFNRWFEENSGYALHPRRYVKLTGCCAVSIEVTGQLVWIPEKYPLCRCGVCGNLYARCETGYVRITHPLRYRITEQ